MTQLQPRQYRGFPVYWTCMGFVEIVERLLVLSFLDREKGSDLQWPKILLGNLHHALLREWPW